MAIRDMKLAEKLLFGVFALVGTGAIISFVVMEVFRARSDKLMYPVFQYNFSAEGLRGSSLYRQSGCSVCHRAMRSGTSMGLVLDGIGSKRTPEYLLNFLKTPEATYPAKTMDHGPLKGAAHVEKLPEADLQAIAIFLSELRTPQGTAAARLPPEGESAFIDNMLKMWAPDSWKSEYKDVREEMKLKTKENLHDTGSESGTK